MTIGERIRLLRKQLGMNQQKFSRKIGISRSYLAELEKGKYEPPDRILYLISHTFGVSYEWLKEGKGEMWERPPIQEHIEKVVWVPVLSRIPAGYPLTPPSPEDIEEWIALPPSWVPKNYFVVKVVGSSMEDELHEGDYVVVRPVVIHGTLPEHYVGRVVIAANIEGEYTIKRLVKEGNEYYLVPDNPAFKEKIKINDNWHLVGVVVDVISRKGVSRKPKPALIVSEDELERAKELIRREARTLGVSLTEEQITKLAKKYLEDLKSEIIKEKEKDKEVG